MKFGFPPVVIKTQDKANYILALRQADSDLIENFIDYIANNLARSLEIIIKAANDEEIEDDDDIEKKISLLKQHLKNPINHRKTPKTKEAILDIFDNSISTFFEKFCSACEKFDEFYQSKNFEFSFAGENGSILITDPAKFQTARSKIEENIYHITLSYHYKNLKVKDHFRSTFTTSVLFKFDLDSFTLSHRNHHLTKSYSEQLTSEEIHEVIKQETQKHYKELEQKIKTTI